MLKNGPPRGLGTRFRTHPDSLDRNASSLAFQKLTLVNALGLESPALLSRLFAGARCAPVSVQSLLVFQRLLLPALMGLELRRGNAVVARTPGRRHHAQGRQRHHAR